MANEISTYTHEGMELPFEDWSKTLHSFNDLASIIQSTHDAAQSSAVRAINRMQTMRNWLIGYYIVEFEQHGKDRAEYGTQLLKKLEERVNRKGLNVTLFQTSRNFYGLYPQMGGLFVPNEIYSTLSNKLGTDSSFISELADSKANAICATASHKLQTSPEMIVSRLSFSHLREIMSVDDPLARYFYEQECIKCTWSVRELRRQISTNLYFRAGISANPEKMLSLPSVQGHDSAALQIRQPFTFEFLGLKAQETVDEHNLEDALISHLQEFILEMLCKGLHNISNRKCCRLSRMACSKSVSVTNARSFNSKNSKVTGVLITSLGCNKVACCWTKAERASLFLDSPLRS